MGTASAFAFAVRTASAFAFAVGTASAFAFAVGTAFAFASSVGTAFAFASSVGTSMGLGLSTLRLEELDVSSEPASSCTGGLGVPAAIDSAAALPAALASSCKEAESGSNGVRPV